MDQAGNFFNRGKTEKTMLMEFLEKMLLVLLEKLKKNLKRYTKLNIQQFLYEARYGQTRDSF